MFVAQKPKYELKPLPITITESLGARIARIRKERGMTQGELAEIIGIEQALVSDYERERIRMYDDLLIRFALALKVTSDELLGIKDYKPDFPALSLRLMKRLAVIEKLPETKKKHIIRTLDDSIKANAPDTEEIEP